MPSHPQRSGQPTESFTTSFDAHVDAVPGSRHDFVEWMRDAELDPEMVDDLEVVYSELAANAVAASPGPADEVRVEAEIEPGMLVLEVSNRTDDPRRLPRTPDLDDPLRSNGRGLLIARAFVDSIEVEVTAAGRLLVRCCRRLAPLH
jgi:anti-sigma regulatory factor (Ser/Thr protein kinase)